jgi:hypothetical protein
MTPTAHRRLLFAEAGLLLVPTTLLALVAAWFAVVATTASHTPARALVFVNGVLALWALHSTWTAVGAYRAQGDAGLRQLRWRVVVAMQLGLLLVAIGVLAWVIGRVAAPIVTGALSYNVLGAPAVVACLHLLWLRRRAFGVEASPTPARRPKTGIALAVFAVALLGLQWLVTGPLPFDRARWASDGLNRRARMAAWLVLDGSLIGLGRVEAIARLGRPVDGVDGDLDFAIGDNGDPLGFGMQVLRLEFDARGRVVHAGISEID